MLCCGFSKKSRNKTGKMSCKDSYYHPDCVLGFYNLKNMEHFVKAREIDLKIFPDILAAVEPTPLVRLNKIPQSLGIKCEVYAKCEFLNPGGSIKDRIAVRMVDYAERHGILKPGVSVIVEPTSGNTGIGLALVAAVRGYRCILVIPEKMSEDKVATIKALGAEVVRTPDVKWNDPNSDIMISRKLVKDIPHAVMLNQFGNPNNPLAHYDGTAEEILYSVDNKMDMFVAGPGTGGTLTGVATKIKEVLPHCKIVACDPYGSYLALPPEINKTNIKFFEIEGIGSSMIPETLNRRIVDKWVKTKDKESFDMARRLIKEEGLLCGGSSGAAMWTALEEAKLMKPGQKVVVILPDGIRNYMTKFVTDQWMEARNFFPIPRKDEISWWQTPVSEETYRPAVTLSLRNSAEEAFAKLKETNAPLLVVKHDDGDIAGIFTADFARRKIVNDCDLQTKPLEKFIHKEFYKVNLADDPTLGRISRILDITDTVVVITNEAGKGENEDAIGIITSLDLLKQTQNGTSRKG